MPARLGVDLAASVIYLACADSPKVHAAARINTENLASSLEVLKHWLLSYCHEYKTGKEVWIEQAWVNGLHFPRAGMMIMRSATIVEVVATEVGLQPMFVHPLTWRKQLYGNAKQIDTKASALKFLAEHFDYDLPVMGSTGRGKTPDHNIAEAILIAHYGGHHD